MENRTHLGPSGAEQLAAAARDRLREFGITLERKSPGRQADSGADEVAELARTANIQFIDASDNAFITFGGVFVDVRGVEPVVTAQPAEPSMNLFSRSRAQVVLALLARPELIGARRREIAKAAGTSLGQAHDVLTQLEEAGFLVPAAHGPARFDEPLDLWTAAYSTGLGPRLEVAASHGDPSRPVVSGSPVYLSGETANGVAVARPAALRVYLDSLEPKLPIANRWSGPATGSRASAPAPWPGCARRPPRKTGPGSSVPAAGGRVHAMEYAWLDAMRTTILYAYRFDARHFRPFQEHAWVATEPVEPLTGPEPVGDLIECLARAGIQLRLLDDLWPCWDEVVGSTAGFSGIRLRNARPRTAPAAR